MAGGKTMDEQVFTPDRKGYQGLASEVTPEEKSNATRGEQAEDAAAAEDKSKQPHEGISPTRKQSLRF